MQLELNLSRNEVDRLLNVARAAAEHSLASADRLIHTDGEAVRDLVDRIEQAVVEAEIGGEDEFVPGSGRMEPITEADNKDVIEGWFKTAETMTEEYLPEFVRHVLHDYKHDYGTICHAVAACALAAAWAADRSEQGGLTGFQGGFIMWQFIRRWLHKEGPLCLVEYRDMLYPQYEHEFDRTITRETAKWLVDEARKELVGDIDRHMPDEVRKHLERIAEGWIPFGYTVRTVRDAIT